MELAPIKATTDSKRISLVVTPEGILRIEKTEGQVGIEMTPEEQEFTLDFILRFMEEASKRAQYAAWKRAQGFSGS